MKACPLREVFLIMTTIEDADNIADMKYSMFPRSENYSEIQGPSVINLLEVEQIHSCVNKIDRDTAGTKKSATRSRTRWKARLSRISLTKTPTIRRNMWSEFDRVSWND